MMRLILQCRTETDLYACLACNFSKILFRFKELFTEIKKWKKASGKK